MLAWLQSIDTALFRFINRDLSCPALDMLLQPLDSNSAFLPAAILGAVLLCWRGGTRGRLYSDKVFFHDMTAGTEIVIPLKAAINASPPQWYRINIVAGQRPRTGKCRPFHRAQHP